MRPPRELLLLVLVLLPACTGGTEDPGDGAPPPPVVPGIEARVELVAPAETGAGKVPTFEWQAFQGATSYALSVLDPEGNAIWVWQGEDTSVALGGLTVDRPPGEAGPVVVTGSSWLVAALDDEGHVIAVSAERPVSP